MGPGPPPFSDLNYLNYLNYVNYLNYLNYLIPGGRIK